MGSVLGEHHLLIGCAVGPTASLKIVWWLCGVLTTFAVLWYCKCCFYFHVPEYGSLHLGLFILWLFSKSELGALLMLMSDVNA